MDIKNLRNIIITSTVGATVMCNDTGLVFCTSCINATIKGIIWDQCGDISIPKVAGITFESSSNIIIINCTFQQFKVCSSVNMSSVHVSGSIVVINSKFMFNSIPNASVCDEIFYSSLVVLPYQDSDYNYVNVVICNSLFYYNGYSDQGSASSNGSFFVTILNTQ